MNTYDIAVVGGGIAGFTAALTAKNLNMDFIWLAPKPFAGKTSAAESVRNFPSFSGSGEAFAAALREQMERERVFCTAARIDEVYKTAAGYLLAAGPEPFSSRTVVLCTGVDLRGAVKGEEAFMGRGVSYCVVCDGPLYRGKTVAAMLTSPRFEEEAELLAVLAGEVHVFRSYEGKPFRSPKIVCHSGMIRAVEGEKRVERVLSDEGTLEVDGLFLLREAAPPAALVGGLRCEGAHIKVKRDMSTNLKGLFAAGDVTGPPYQFAKAAGEGLTAAYSARDFLLRAKTT